MEGDFPAAEAAVSTGDTSLRKLSQDTLYVALVQDKEITAEALHRLVTVLG